jgi:hypothetical protein
MPCCAAHALQAAEVAVPHEIVDEEAQQARRQPLG